MDIWALLRHGVLVHQHVHMACGCNFMSANFFFLIYFYFWLRWVFVAAHSLSLVVASRGLLFVAVHGLIIAVASLIVEHGL